MGYKNLVVEIEDSVGIVTINRPKYLNALNTEALTELKGAIDKLEKEAKVIIITGAERAFVAGGDIGEMMKMSPLEAKRYSQLGHETLFKIEDMSRVVIAAVNGYALGGGCELAMACDIRIASEKAKFGQPEINLGVTPGFGGTQRLPRLVGKAVAKELVLTGRVIDASEALRIGLVNSVVEHEKMMVEAKALAREIASKGQIAVKLAKEDINKGLDVDLGSGCAIETNNFALCFSTMDKREGMKAFLEKRKARFKDK